LSRLRDDAGEVVASRLGVPVLEGALPRLVEDPAYRLSIIDPVISARMSFWPIVSIFHGLLTPLLAMVRRNVGMGSSDVNVNDYLTVEGESLPTMIQTTFAQLQQSNPAISTLYRDNKLWESIASESAAHDLQRRLNETLRRQREAAMERLGRREGWIMPFFRVMLTVGAILWFPIVQPILEILLQGSALSFSPELALRIVQLLGVTFLLENLTFLLLWFAVLWAIVRAAAYRSASRLITRWQRDPKLDPALSFTGQTLEWIDGLLDPIQRQQEQIDSLIARVEKLREENQMRSAA
jgi:hypothetical protein